MSEYEDFLSHHGVKGQKWGVRRYQNKDGSYTDAGKKNRSLLAKYSDKQGHVSRGKLGKADYDSDPDVITKRRNMKTRAATVAQTAGIVGLTAALTAASFGVGALPFSGTAVLYAKEVAKLNPDVIAAGYTAIATGALASALKTPMSHVKKLNKDLQKGSQLRNEIDEYRKSNR